MSEIIASGIVQKSTLQKYLDVFTPIVDEGKLHFNDDGLQVRCVESANVAMINPGLLKASAFESYEPTGAVTQGVDFNRLEEMISPAGSNELVEIGIDMETRKLNIAFENVETAMGLFDPDSVRKEPDVPGLDLPNEIILEGGDLARVVNVADMVSDHVSIQTDPETQTVEFVADGDMDESTVEFGVDDRIDGEQVKEVTSIFSIEYLDRIVTPMPDNAEVTMQFGDEFPMILEWEAEGGALDIFQMLAPRIVND